MSVIRKSGNLLVLNGAYDKIQVMLHHEDYNMIMCVKSSILVLWIWRKLLIGCQEK